MFINKEEKKLEGFCLIKTLEEKQTSTGKNYFNLVLGDKDTELSCKLWDSDKYAHIGFEASNLVYVTGLLEEYQGVPQGKVATMRKASLEEADPMDFVPCAPYEAEVMYGEIIDTINAFEDEDYKKITLDIIESVKDKLMYWPAALKMHHAIRYGLLFHTTSMLKIVKKYYDIYSELYNINADLLYAGTILHDIAKIEEMEVSDLGLCTDYSFEGQLLGHLFIGASKIKETADKYGVGKEKYVLLQHMIASHHEKPEWGAITPCKTIEALLLSNADLLDARLFECNDALNEVEEDEGFTGKCFALGNVPIYKHK